MEHYTEHYFKRPIRRVKGKVIYVTSSLTGSQAQRIYLTTALFWLAALFLLVPATGAYLGFYWIYIPKKVISLPVHLQYNSGVNPYGLTYVSRGLMQETAYDVSVEIILPRSPTNLDRGNFMIALFAMRSAPDNPAHSWSIPADPYEHVNPENVVFSARRPTLVPYIDPLVSTSSRLMFLPWHILVPESEQAKLTIPMGEMVEFRDQLPLSILLDVQAGQTIQVYSAKIELVARLSGIRWAMYNHRIVSFFVMTGAFWFLEMMAMGLGWLLLSCCCGGRNPGQRKIFAVDGTGDGAKNPGAVVKREGEGPAGDGGQVKQENDGMRLIKEDSVESDMATMDSPRRPGTADADDEESTGFGEGSGTSYHDRNVRRRSSQKGSW